MTRVNVIQPEELNNKMLVAEAHEITRVFGLARKAQFDIMKGKRNVPLEYALGTNHVLFFYNKLKFIADRYEALVLEMQGSFGSDEPHSQRRGYKPNTIPREELLAGINPKLYNDYQPTAEAITINRQRIQERLSAKAK